MTVVLDNQIIDYDLEKYSFPAWVRDHVTAAGYDATDLQRLHETVPLSEISPLTQRLIRETEQPAFREMACGFVREVVRPILQADVALQRFFNIRIMLPDRQDMIIAFHNGTWYGHGLGETTIWMPLTQAEETNSLQVIDREASRKINANAIENRWRHDQLQQACLAQARPVSLVPGQVLLFQQENLHGNVMNQTGRTRVSIDFRVAVAGGALHRKLVGGYFDLLDAPASAPARASDGVCISYVNNNTRIASGIPIHLQRLMMRNYCETHGLQPTYEQLEIEVMPHLPTLLKILEQDRPADVLLYSVYALPDGADDRKELLELALQQDVTLHFANEDRRVSNQAEADLVERILTFASLESPV